MGWLFMSRDGMGGHATPKAYLDAQFTYKRDLGEGETGGLQVLDSSLVNRVWYAAAREIKNGVPGAAFALVCLVRWNPNSSTREHFGYKDMDESMGPHEADCPQRILDLLTPTDRPYAIEWRARCRANLALRRRPLRDGMRIRFDAPLTFTDGYEGDEFIVVRSGAKIRFRRPGGTGLYRISGHGTAVWNEVRTTVVHKTAFARHGGADALR